MAGYTHNSSKGRRNIPLFYSFPTVGMRTKKMTHLWFRLEYAEPDQGLCTRSMKVPPAPTPDIYHDTEWTKWYINDYIMHQTLFSRQIIMGRFACSCVLDMMFY